jgi:hypothetical protein
MPGQECYDVCSNAWNFFVGDSLRLLAEHGQGKPESNTGQAEPAKRAHAAADALDQQPRQRRPGTGSYLWPAVPTTSARRTRETTTPTGR